MFAFNACDSDDEKSGSGEETNGENNNGGDDGKNGDGNGGGERAELFSDSLHNGVDVPQTTGEVWVEVDGTRFDFKDVDCRWSFVTDSADEEKHFIVSGNLENDTWGPVDFEVHRQVGDGQAYPDAYESEVARFTLEGGWEERESNQNGLLQHDRYEKDGFKWHHGNADIPAIRVLRDGSFSVKGTLGANPVDPDKDATDILIGGNCTTE